MVCQPFYDERANRLQMGIQVGLCWTYVVALVVACVAEAGAQDSLAIAWVGGAFAAMLVASVAAGYHIPLSSSSAQVAPSSGEQEAPSPTHGC